MRYINKSTTTKQVSIASFAMDHSLMIYFLGKAIEYMVVDALTEADPVLHLSRKIDNPDEYLYLTDSVLEDIEKSTHPVRSFVQSN